MLKTPSRAREFWGPARSQNSLHNPCPRCGAKKWEKCHILTAAYYVKIRKSPHAERNVPTDWMRDGVAISTSVSGSQVITSTKEDYFETNISDGCNQWARKISSTLVEAYAAHLSALESLTLADTEKNAT